MAAIYTVITLVALCGLVSLGVDMGRVQLARTELQSAADAAVRAAAAGFANGVTAARDEAVELASANLCDGTAIVLDRTADIEFGTWDADTKTFTLLTGSGESSATAIRVSARRVASRNTAIPLAFASLVGRSTCDVKAIAIATMTPATTGAGGPGAVGLSYFGMDNNSVVKSYDSTKGRPSASNSSNHATVGSNKQLDMSNNSTIGGDVSLGPGASMWKGNNASVTGSTSYLKSPMSYPDVNPGNAATVNDNARVGLTNKNRSPLSGKSFWMSNSETISIPAGTYFFDTFWIDNGAKVTFTGPVTIYVRYAFGLNNNAEVAAAGDRPGNLKLQMMTWSAMWLSNNSQLTADLYAPNGVVGLGNNAQFNGRVIADTVWLSNGADVYIDQSLAGTGGSSGGGSGGGGAMKIAVVR